MKVRLFTALFWLVSATLAAQSVKSPNVVIILADDLGIGDLTCYNPGSQISTPVLDGMAAQGLRFTDAHSGSSVCTPTRYGLLTGRYAFRSPLKKGVLFGYSPSLIEADRFTLADLLHEAGYYTGVIGKWHLGLDWATVKEPARLTGDNDPANFALLERVRQGPNDLGFDYSFVLPASLDMAPYVFVENGQVTPPTLRQIAGNREPRGVFWREGTAGADFRLEETLDRVAEKGCAFIRQRAGQEAPFFLYLPLTSPHTPWLPESTFRGKSGAGTYGDFVMQTDAAIGRVLHTLDSLRLRENTLVIITSDNGSDWKDADKQQFPKHRANGPYRGEKSDIWEGGHRIPFLVRWPAGITRTGVISQTICLTDLMATLASLTRRTLKAGNGPDSFDFSSLFSSKNRKKAVRQTTIHHSIDGLFALREGRWKYIDGSGSGGWSKDSSATRDWPEQLYDLDADPGETTNLARQLPNLASRLRNTLHKQQEQGFTRSNP